MRRGANYRTGNRTDVAQPATQPVQTPTGLPYGEAGQLAQQQKQVPLPTQGSVPGGFAPPAPQQGADFGAVLQAAKGVQPPSSTLNAPSTRPGESVTAGLAPPGQLPTTMPTAGSLLSTLALSPGATPEIRQLAQFYNSGRQ